jgi:murein DD-endopeptidase MepM/ murein hydrolase activator NlpD
MGQGPGKTAILLIAAPAAVLLGAVLLVVVVLGGPAAACTRTATTVGTGALPPGPVAGYPAAQLANAALVIDAGTALGLGRDAQTLAVMAAMGESALTVLDRGDTAGADSRGLFQQRDDGAWGSYADRMDPTISATNFYTALTRVPGWETLEPTIAIHKVQRNADPYHYETYQRAAEEVVAALAGTEPARCASGPLAAPLSPGYTLTDDYGPRTAPTLGASSWHPAVDLQHPAAACGDPIHAVTAGTVVHVGGYQISIKSPAGYTVSYLHMKPTDILVDQGDPVRADQIIALTGNEGPSTGCHLDLRIDKTGSTDPAVAALADGPDHGGPPATAGYVDPEEFFALFGLQLCAPGSCTRNPA